MSNYKDLKHKNLVDAGTTGTKVAVGTTAQRGSTTGQWRYNSSTTLFEGRDDTGFVSLAPSPSVTAVSPTVVESADGGNTTFTITGNNFATTGAAVKFIGSDGTEVTASSVTVNSATSITAVIASNEFANAKEPYDVKVINSNSNLASTLSDQINVDNAPTFDVASGSLGTLQDADRAGSNLTAVTATDAEGDSITFAVTSGSIPGGLTFNSDGTFSGTANAVGSTTTSTFTVTATAGGKTATRQYTITVAQPIASGGTTSTYTDGGTTYVLHTFTSNGNFVLNTAKSVTYLMIAGGGGGGAGMTGSSWAAGGGGAGGLLTGTSSLSAGTFPIVIGQGGSGQTASDTAQGADGGDTTFNSLTATGGGGGGSRTITGANQSIQNGRNGGSGGGVSGVNPTETDNYTAGTGVSGQGNNGGDGHEYGGNGGGGAGAVGGVATSKSQINGVYSAGADGGAGTSNSITGSAVTYAGGGGGGGADNNSASSQTGLTSPGGTGGSGGGGDGGKVQFNSGTFVDTGRDGADATGYGSGGGGGAGGAIKAVNAGGRHAHGGDGSDGVVIIRYAA
tara:strand:+ start:466 stop:2160 length:1695 start_codon:yes stop_codon:yes gene_type:complete